MDIDRRGLIASAGSVGLGLMASAVLAPVLVDTAEAAPPSGAWPFQPLSQSALRSPRKFVAHWHIFPHSTANAPPAVDYYTALMSPDLPGYEEVGGYTRQRPLPRNPRPEPDWMVLDAMVDIQNAVDLGLDAFLFNVTWFQRQGPNWDRLFALLQAARRLNNGFKIALSIDGSANPNPWRNELVNFIASLNANPCIMRHDDGRMILSCFWPENLPVEFWTEVKTQLANRGIPLYLVFNFVSWSAAWGEYGQLADVIGTFGGSLADSDANVVRHTFARSIGKEFMVSVMPQDFRPKQALYFEAKNSLQFRSGWWRAIGESSDWAVLSTWNDYSEGSEVSPSTGTQHGYYDLCAYFAAIYKTGRGPAIVRDTLYYFHRVQHTENTTLRLQTSRFACRSGPPLNEIELVGFLTEPGTLEIVVGGTVIGSGNFGAGMQVLHTSLRYGRPSFRLRRNGAIMAEVESAFDIRSSADYQDLLYRSGSSRRSIVAMVANSAE